MGILLVQSPAGGRRFEMVSAQSVSAAPDSIDLCLGAASFRLAKCALWPLTCQARRMLFGADVLNPSTKTYFFPLVGCFPERAEVNV
jgi:hypothetical protein